VVVNGLKKKAKRRCSNLGGQRIVIGFAVLGGGGTGIVVVEAGEEILNLGKT
jgi:hypothetical protein